MAALAFFGAAGLAPVAMADAFAAGGTGPGSQSAVLERQANQRFVANDTVELALDLGVSPADEGDFQPKGALYTLEQFLFSGVVNWGGYKFTYYSQQVLPGQGLDIPGRHVNAGGFISDRDGYIVLAGSAAKGTVFETPFGYQGKIYDRGTVGNHLDVYIR